MLLNIKFKSLMCMTLIVLLFGLAVPFSMLYLRLVKISQYVATDVVNGYANLEEYDFVVQPPISLDGNYLGYKGVFQTGDQLDYSVLNNPIDVYLPSADLQRAAELYTYQVFVALTEPEASDKEILLSVPFVNSGDINLYINGTKVSPLVLDDVYNNTEQLTYYSITKHYDATRTHQEITMSVNQSEDNVVLFKRDIAISTYENQLELYKLIVTVEAYFIGMVFVSILNTIIYLVLYPKHSTLVFVNLFDTVLMLHCLLNMLLAPTVIANLANFSNYFNTLSRSVDLVTLFLAALLSNSMFTTLFNTSSNFQKKLDRLIVLFYLGMVMLVLLNPTIMSGIGIPLGLVISGITVFALFYKFIFTSNDNKISFYRIFHLFKSILISGVIFLDILTINQYSPNRNKVFTLYCIIFVINLATRCLEYRLPFMKIKTMNSELEGTVAKRTQALTSANEALQKLIERDALTNAFNRLYFENKLAEFTKAYLQSNLQVKSVYLCIFDADSFKRINDTYGHSVGDDQLIEMANLPLKYIGDDVILTRIGGEEFAILFTNYTKDNVLSVLERIRREFESVAVTPNRTTASFGVAKLTSGYSKKEFFSTADKCLYHSKTSGKNMITYNFNGEMKVYKEEI